MSHKHFVLDGKGCVELQESFGSDLTVVNAARVSFAKEVNEFKEGDKKLINYLVKHNHISPFFHPQIRFRLKMPIFVARDSTWQCDKNQATCAPCERDSRTLVRVYAELIKWHSTTATRRSLALAVSIAALALSSPQA